MKIVIAPDSYKECLTALQVAISIESGFREVFPDAVYIKVPVADGGEGTVDAMIEATSGRRVVTTVRGPLGDPVEAFYGLTGDGRTAMIEMAAASGLALVPPALRNPEVTGEAPLVLDGAMNGIAFRAYVKQVLVPALLRGDVVVMDNLPAHKCP